MCRRGSFSLAALVGAVVFYLALTHQSPPQPGSGTSADKLCRKLLAEKTREEALSWVQQSEPKNVRTVGEQNPADSLKIVKKLYDAGAVQVYAVDCRSRDGSRGDHQYAPCGTTAGPS